MIRLAAASLALASLWGSAAAQTASRGVLDAVEGTWELDPAETPEENIRGNACGDDPVRIDISADGETYTWTRAADGVFVADVIDVLEAFPEGPALWIRYHDEQRLDPAGNPVEWLLVMQDLDSFYWVRKDWLEGDGFGRTGKRRRCPRTDIS